MSKFILEIGVEELPARFLPGLETELADKAAIMLSELDLDYAELGVSATPRRCKLEINGLAASQPVREEVATGPALRAAYDAEGQPTRAAIGFAASLGAKPEDLFQVETEKGVYVALRKQSGGKSALEALPPALVSLISSLSFPKRMRWGDGDFAYARPIRWLLALLDEQIVPFTIGKVSSDRQSRGLRSYKPGPVSVDSAANYSATIRDQFQITLPAEERRQMIVEGGNKLATQLQGKVLWKNSLLTEVCGLTEHPVPMIGDFDPSFLELPPQVLLTSMESHQKSFGLQNSQGQMLPHFLTVLNLTPPDPQLVKQGWERVLRARLEDARFYWRTDLKSSFGDWLDRLEQVIFLGPLGSMADKTRRLEGLCLWLAENVVGPHKADPSKAARAGRLSKADLVTQMVGEFDTLQGIMGGIYAKDKGEDADVATALAEQYLPAGPDSPLPQSELGAILAVADKADTLVGCFGLGNIPTGAADPYALRRFALGIARIVMDRGWRLNLADLFAKAHDLYKPDIAWKLPREEALSKLEAFFAGRLKNLFLSQGYDTLLVEAVLGAPSHDVWATRQRLLALDLAGQRPDFAATAQTFKRVTNILNKQTETLSGVWVEDYLQEQAESQLATALLALENAFAESWQADDFSAALTSLGQIRPLVDNFFEQVMVMAEDANVRRNRLNLLKSLLLRMEKIADFSALRI